MKELHRLLQRQLKRCLGESVVLTPEWHKLLCAISDFYHDVDMHRTALERSLVLSSRELHQANAEMRAVFQAIPDLLFCLDHHGRILDCKAGTTGDLLLPREAYFNKYFQRVPRRDVREKLEAAIRRVAEDKALVMVEYSLTPHQEDRVYEARLVPLGKDQIVVIVQNITARRQSEARLKETHDQLLEVSRRAGMAEVAISVLHNVGNVLNSVNVSTAVLLKNARNSRIANLAKAIKVIQDHSGDLARFFAQDPKGGQILGYLQKLAEFLTHEQTAMIEELTGLRDSVEHINEIVARQQSFAKTTGVLESLDPIALVDDALRLTSAYVEHRGIQIVREFSPTPAVMADKHKVLQILINLLRNAKDALDEAHPSVKRIAVQIGAAGDQRVKISVIDNGIGIDAELRDRIFQYGFTTRKTGHGFGLHNSCLVAHEIGGTLSVHSDGAGRGTTFTLELPMAARS